MASLPTIDETRAHTDDPTQGSRPLAPVQGPPRRSPSAASASASASPAAWGPNSDTSAASSPAYAPAASRGGVVGGEKEKRKRHAFESDEDEDEEEAKGATRRGRSVQARTGQQSQPRRGGDSSRSPSPARSVASVSVPSRTHAAASSASSSLAAASSFATSAPSAPFSLHDPSLSGCRSVRCYRRLNQIDEGSYGVVHRAEDRASGVQVALKKIKLDSSAMAVGGFPITALREINILLSLSHPNIVGLREIVTAKPPKGPDGKTLPGAQHSIYMVMDYAEHDLKALMLRMGASHEDKAPSASAGDGASNVPAAFQPFRVPEIKNLLRQLLEGVAYAHRHWILHRDLKTSNLLYDAQGRLRICDFGLARRYGEPLGSYTPLVVTLWYRSPELLWGTKKYSSAVDMWSVGCIFAELLLNRPLLTGQSEMEQIGKMTKLLGTPSLDSWPEFAQLEHAQNYSFAKVLPSRLRELFPTHSYTASTNALTEQGFNLLSQMLCYNPARRISAADALAHPYFSEAPLPQSQALMPTFPASNERQHDDSNAPNSGDLKRKREQQEMGFYL